MSSKRADTAHDPFAALADETRRRILEMLRDGAVCTAGAIAGAFPGISRPAVSRHLRVLREAGLVIAEGIGREQHYRLNAAALARLHRDWFARFAPLWDASLGALKAQVESAAARPARRRQVK